MNLVIYILLFFLALFIIAITFYNSNIESMTTGEMALSSVNLACPPIGKDGTIQCPNIEDPVLKKQTCDALVQRCKIELNDDIVKTRLKSTNLTKGMMLFS